jgi:large subunit ribosomal protein L29
MKSKNWNEIKNMTETELSLKLSQLQDKLFRLKFRHQTVPVKNPLEIRGMRRDIARIKTLVNQKRKEPKYRLIGRNEYVAGTQ